MTNLPIASLSGFACIPFLFFLFFLFSLNGALNPNCRGGMADRNALPCLSDWLLFPHCTDTRLHAPSESSLPQCCLHRGSAACPSSVQSACSSQLCSLNKDAIQRHFIWNRPMSGLWVHRDIWLKTQLCAIRNLLDWFWLPIFLTNLVRGFWNKEMEIQNKGAILVQIAPLFISQPRNQNQSIQTIKECCHIYCAHHWPRLAAIGIAPCAVSNRQSRYPRTSTGTRPDYLVNRVPQELRGSPGEKTAQKSRNSCAVNGRSCGCIGTVDSELKCAQS